MSDEPVKELEPLDPNQGGCGSVPTRPGGTGAGDWQCRDGNWVWVENIGG